MHAPRIGLLVVALAIGEPVCPQHSESRLVRIRFPQDSWAVSLNLPGFEIGINGAHRDGRRYLLASDRATGVNVSLMLERVKEPPTLEGCRAHFGRISRQEGLTEVRLTEEASRVRLEYTIGKMEGVELNQRFFRVCTVHADQYVDLNLSKVRYRQEDVVFFETVANTMRFEENAIPGSFEYWVQGSAEYRKGNLKRSIKPYRQALDLEQRDRQLDTTFWRVLVDNLGMAYGLTGDLKSAMEVFEYGLSVDPNYPLFHYNMACAYAEKKDRASALRYLRQAFALKHNVIASERMPDPRGDDSFRRFMGDKEFREEVEALAGYLDTMTMSVKGKQWQFAIELPGFKVSTDAETKYGGRGLQAWNEETGTHVSILLNPLSAQSAAGTCEDSWKKRMEVTEPTFSSTTGVRRSESSGMKRLEYTELTYPPGRSPIRRKILHGCMVHDDFYAMIEIWKPQHEKKDEVRMSQILDSVRFVTTVPPIR